MSRVRRRRRWIGPIAIVLTGLCAAVLIYQNWTILSADPDVRAVSFERWKRHTAYAAGYPLPGTPDLAKFDERLQAEGLTPGAPIFMRIFKREFELEIWMLKDSKFKLFATYPICRWSGRLGPKLRQGDRQAPEGFYTVDKGALNPNSRWHRSFNLGFPNLYDRLQRRTGSFLMVHGGCSSIGCYAMTNDVIDEIWKIVTSALEGGQKRFQVHVFPFRMSEDNLAAREENPKIGFWRDLKAGYDLFQQSGLPPKVSVCKGRYTLEPRTVPGDASDPIVARCSPEKTTG